MKTVANILNKKVYHYNMVETGTNVMNALSLMNASPEGFIIVTRDGSYAGIVTERDYSRKVILQNKHSDTTIVSEIMTTDLPQVSPNDTIDHCMSLLTENKIRYLPVFNNNSLSGIISMSDVVKATILAQEQTINDLHTFIHS